MTLTYAQANDEILALLKTVWDPTGHKLFYEDVRDQRDEDQSPWAMVVVRHAAGQQDSLGGRGRRSFLRLGVAIITIHTPSGSGLSNAYALAKVVADAYEGVSSPNGVWFRNVRVNELGRFGTFFQTNVLIDFEYTETK